MTATATLRRTPSLKRPALTFEDAPEDAGADVDVDFDDE